MPPTELEARRWQAALDAVRGKNELAVRIEHREGRTTLWLYLDYRSEETLALWETLGEFGGANICLPCTTAEWVEMLAQGSK